MRMDAASSAVTDLHLPPSDRSPAEAPHAGPDATPVAADCATVAVPRSPQDLRVACAEHDPADVGVWRPAVRGQGE